MNRDENLSNISVIFQHQDFVVIDKPAGVSFHNEAGEGLFNLLNHIPVAERLFPVHRLDKVTSGLLVLAKNKSSQVLLQKLFSESKIEKFYIAIAESKPRKKRGTIVGDLKKTRRGCWKLQRSRINPSKTQFFSFFANTGLRLYLLKPHTGRTHQLRVVMSSLGVPILGDTRYGARPSDRAYLHAYGLRFVWKEKLVEVHHDQPNGDHFETERVRLLLKENIFKPWDLNWPDFL